MKKFTLILTIVVLVLGVTQCRKPSFNQLSQIYPGIEGREKQKIEFGSTDGGAKINIYSLSNLEWESKDVVYVYEQNEDATAGNYLGYLSMESLSEGIGLFTGEVSKAVMDNVLFYYFGKGVQKDEPQNFNGNNKVLSVDFSDQTAGKWESFLGIEENLVMCYKAERNQSGEYLGTLTPCFAVLPIEIMDGGSSKDGGVANKGKVTVTKSPATGIKIGKVGKVELVTNESTKNQIEYNNQNRRVVMAVPQERLYQDTKVNFETSTDVTAKAAEFDLILNDKSVTQGSIVDAKTIMVNVGTHEEPNYITPETPDNGVASIDNNDNITLIIEQPNVITTTIDEPFKAIARIGDVKYESVHKALKDAMTEYGDDVEIVMLEDVDTLTHVLMPVTGKNITINLDGYRYTTIGDGDTPIFTVNGSNNFGLTNGTIITSSNGGNGGLKGVVVFNSTGTLSLSDLTMSNNHIAEFDVEMTAGILDADNVIIHAENGGGIYFRGTSGTIDNCVIDQCSYSAVSVGNGGSLTINGGTYESAYSAANVSDKGGTITLNSGYFTTPYTNGHVLRTDSNTGSDACCINVVGHDVFVDGYIHIGTNSDGSNSFVIIDGVFKNYLSVDADASSKAEVTGGVFDRVDKTLDEDDGFPHAKEGYFGTNNVSIEEDRNHKDYRWTVIEDKKVAEINGIQYTSRELQSGIDGISGETTITLINDLHRFKNAGYTIGSGKNIILDLNGHKMRQKAPDAAGSYFIRNYGVLTVTDNSTSALEQQGYIKVYSENPDPYYGYGNYTIDNRNTLNVNNGTISVASPTDGGACFAIDNNSSGSVPTLNMNGGRVESLYSSAIRSFANSETCDNILNINGGEISGASGIWVQLPGNDSNDKPKSTVNITGGTIRTINGGTYSFYDYSHGNKYDNVEYNISGGTLSNDVLSYGADIEIAGGTFNNYVYAKNCNVNVKGGTFNGDGYFYAYGSSNLTIQNGSNSSPTFNVSVYPYGSSCTISGGTFNSYVQAYNANSLYGKLTISGGNFSKYVDAYNGLEITGGIFDGYIYSEKSCDLTVPANSTAVFNNYVTLYSTKTNTIAGGTYNWDVYDFAGSEEACFITGGKFKYYDEECYWTNYYDKEVYKVVEDGSYHKVVTKDSGGKGVNVSKGAATNKPVLARSVPESNNLPKPSAKPVNEPKGFMGIK